VILPAFLLVVVLLVVVAANADGSDGFWSHSGHEVSEETAILLVVILLVTA
jgi:hypothetical protein